MRKICILFVVLVTACGGRRIENALVKNGSLVFSINDVEIPSSEVAVADDANTTVVINMIKANTSYRYFIKKHDFSGEFVVVNTLNLGDFEILDKNTKSYRVFVCRNPR